MRLSTALKQYGYQTFSEYDPDRRCYVIEAYESEDDGEPSYILKKQKDGDYDVHDINKGYLGNVKNGSDGESLFKLIEKAK